MSLQIPLEPVPSQRLSVVIAGQNCLLSVYAKTDSMYVDLTVNDVPVLRTQAARNGIGLLFAARYFGFVGELVFIDQQGDEQPSFEGLNDRWLLLYLDELNA